MLSRTFRYTTITASLIAMIVAFVLLGCKENIQSSSFVEDNLEAVQENAAGRAVLATERAAYEQLDFEAPVLRALHASDLSLPDSFTVTFEMSRQTVWYDPDQGTTVCECKLTYLDGVRALSVESPLTSTLIYHPPGTSGYQDMDYNKDGNLIIWHSARKYGLSDGDMNRTLDEQELFLVHPGGAVTLAGAHLQTYEYQVGSENNIHEFEKFRLATGRGFSKHLGTLNSEVAVQGPMQTLDVQGVIAGSGLTGVWEMSVDVEHGHLVREAVFWSDSDSNEPVMRVEAYGDIIDGSDPVLASAGTIEYFLGGDRNYLVEINILDYSTPADEEHLASIRQCLVDAISESVEVVDYSGPVARRYPGGKR